MNPQHWHTACRELAEADATMATLMARYRDVVPKSRGDAFLTLARAIVGQQISVKAADAIWNRLVQGGTAIDPQCVLALGVSALSASGLSARKAAYLHDLAGAFMDGRLEPARWQDGDDEAVIADLVRVRGIGRWTAQMFLIFNLQRPDVWPVDDIGLQKAMAEHYLAGERPSPTRLASEGQRFAPWRSVATWYLWRSLDPVVVQY
jgi:DNA-3-methyladenine glycosylase II